MGLNNICLEGDAKLVVDGINSGGPRWTRTGHLVGDLKMLCLFTHWEVRHVGREVNFVVYGSAMLVTQSGLDRL